MKIAIVGSRDFPDMERVRAFVRNLPVDTIVISGGARGVDSVAVDAAIACGLNVQVCPADWSRYGRVAGMIRNRTIVARAEEVVAFWDGKSRGTQHTINIAKQEGKPVTVKLP